MSGKKNIREKYKSSSCPMSSAGIGLRCNAGNPRQESIANPEPWIGEKLMHELGTRHGHAVYRCAHCDVVYVNVGVRGMERILGYLTPQGFKAVEAPSLR
jgi:hypothetical protein